MQCRPSERHERPHRPTDHHLLIQDSTSTAAAAAEGTSFTVPRVGLRPGPAAAVAEMIRLRLLSGRGRQRELLHYTLCWSELQRRLPLALLAGGCWCGRLRGRWGDFAADDDDEVSRTDELLSAREVSTLTRYSVVGTECYANASYQSRRIRQKDEVTNGYHRFAHSYEIIFRARTRFSVQKALPCCAHRVVGLAVLSTRVHRVVVRSRGSFSLCCVG